MAGVKPSAAEQHWRSLIAQEVLAEPRLLQIVRLPGAFIGDIKRLRHPEKLLEYVRLNPAFDEWR